MLNKRFFVIILLVALLFVLFTENVNASYLGNIHGFGNYNVYTDTNGDIVVEIETDGTNVQSDRNHWKGKFDSLFAQYGKTITWLTGIATITLVAVFIWLCIKSAFMASEHWIIKRQTMTAMLWVGVGTALMGSTTLILLIFQNAFI